MTARSETPGPVVWLTGCCHGDEVGGIVIIQEIFKKIRKKNYLKKGAIYAFPLMNPIGFETASRHITFSKEDLNRSFPGNPKGSLGERIADIIFKTITDMKPALVIDLHNDWVRSIPYVLIDSDAEFSNKSACRKTETYAMKAGFPVIKDTEILHKSLSFNLLKKNIPALTLELGESYIVNEKNILYGVKSIENILVHLGMARPLGDNQEYGTPEKWRKRILRYSDKPYSSTSGIIRFTVKPGETVDKGRPIAKIYNTFGKLQETIKAKENGIVLGHADYAVAFPGMPIAAFGVE